MPLRRRVPAVTGRSVEPTMMVGIGILMSSQEDEQSTMVNFAWLGIGPLGWLGNVVVC
jgi:hypothetical protein